jgi:hypothetical chaperone protein
MPVLSCGLDFGTSNSTAGIGGAAGPVLVELENGKPSIPSAIFFPFERKGATRFGRDAISTYVGGEDGRLMRALKSVLGTSLVHESTQIREKQVPFGDILAMFLANMKTRIDATAGEAVSHVAMGRPVYFVDDDPTADAAAEAALKAAAQAVGFTNIVFQYEPIAAALEYESRVTHEELALIIDIGGGTSDFSVVRVGPHQATQADRKKDILANLGIHIGGTDFDRLFSMARLMPLLGYGSPVKGGKNNLPGWHYFNLATWQRINQLYARKVEAELAQIRFDAVEPDKVDKLIYVVDHRLGHTLAGRVEDAKIQLSNHLETTLLAPFGSTPMPVPLTVAQLNEAITESVTRVHATMESTLAEAGVPAQKIAAVFLTGGSSQVPFLRQSLLATFPKARVEEGDMFGSVGLGLTRYASTVFA